MTVPVLRGHSLDEAAHMIAISARLTAERTGRHAGNARSAPSPEWSVGIAIAASSAHPATWKGRGRPGLVFTDSGDLLYDAIDQFGLPRELRRQCAATGPR